LGFAILNEKLTLLSYFGMTLTFAGIAMAIFSKGQNDRLSLKLSPKGILYAFGGALGQAVGLVLSKFGMNSYDPFASTQIRIISAMAGFIIIVTILGKWIHVGEALKNRRGMAGIITGSFFGPFLGVSFSLLAVKYTETGIASTIMSLVPILIIPPAYFIYKQKVTFFEICGAVISVIGVSVFFLR
jgi:drug/metabolite transporter (DMT)-like permease